MEAFGLTDVGCRRAVNQDAFYFDEALGLFVVADGMGGHQAGDLASRLSIRSIVDFLTQQAAISFGDQHIEDKITIECEVCRSAVVCANNEIYKVAEEHPELFGMGTTIDMIKFVDGYGVICHVGDSRIYRLVDGKITQLTKDHTQIQELLDTQQLTQEEAQFSKMKNVITRALGGAEDVEVDTIVVPVREGDVLLLCTDGLTGVMEDWEIREEFSMFDYDLEGAVKSYIQTTLDRGAPDNVTVLMVGPAGPEDALAANDEETNSIMLAELLGDTYKDQRP